MPDGQSYNQSDISMGHDNYVYGSTVSIRGSDDEGQDGYLVTPWPSNIGQWFWGIGYRNYSNEILPLVMPEGDGDGDWFDILEAIETNVVNNWTYIEPFSPVTASTGQMMHTTGSDYDASFNEAMEFWTDWVGEMVSIGSDNQWKEIEVSTFNDGEVMSWPYLPLSNEQNRYPQRILVPSAGPIHNKLTIDGSIINKTYFDFKPVAAFYNHHWMTVSSFAECSATGLIDNGDGYANGFGVTHFGPCQMAAMVGGAKCGEGYNQGESSYHQGPRFEYTPSANSWVGDRDSSYEWSNHCDYGHHDDPRSTNEGSGPGHGKTHKYSLNRTGGSNYGDSIRFIPASNMFKYISGNAHNNATRYMMNNKYADNAASASGHSHAYTHTSSNGGLHAVSFSSGIAVFETNLDAQTDNTTDYINSLARMPWYTNTDVSQYIADELGITEYDGLTAMSDDVYIGVECEIKFDKDWMSNNHGVDMPTDNNPSNIVSLLNSDNDKVPICCAIHPLWDDEEILEGAGDGDPTEYTSGMRGAFDYKIISRNDWGSFTKVEFCVNKDHDGSGFSTFDKMMAVLVGGTDYDYGRFWSTNGCSSGNWANHPKVGYSGHPGGNVGEHPNYMDKNSNGGELQIMFYSPVMHGMKLDYDAATDHLYDEGQFNASDWDDGSGVVYRHSTGPLYGGSSQTAYTWGGFEVKNVRLVIRSKGNRQGTQ